MPRARSLIPATLLALAARPAHAQPAPPPTSGPVFRSTADTPSPAPPPPAASSPPSRVTVRLDYTRGPGAEACPDDQGFRDAVAANVGYDVFTPAGARTALVTIQHQGTAFVGRMELRTATGAQEWSHEPLLRGDCRELVRLMGLSIAIPIDPFPAHPLPPPPVPPPSLAASGPPLLAPLLPPDRDRTTPPLPPPASRPAVRIGLRAGVALGTEPAAAGSFALQVGVRWPFASLSIEGNADLSATGAGNVAPMSQVGAQLFAGSLVPCGHVPLPAHWNIPFCGVLRVGEVRGGGLSVEMKETGTGLYVASGGRVGLEIPVNDTGSIALRVDGELLGAIKPVTITLNSADAWTTGRVNGGAGGGARIDF